MRHSLWRDCVQDCRHGGRSVSNWFVCQSRLFELVNLSVYLGRACWCISGNGTLHAFWSPVGCDDGVADACVIGRNVSVGTICTKGCYLCTHGCCGGRRQWITCHGRCGCRHSGRDKENSGRHEGCEGCVCIAESSHVDLPGSWFT